MKKLLGTTLALAMFVPAGANAELLKNLKVSGNLDIQTTSARNVADLATRPNALSGGAGPGAFSATSNNDRVGAAITRATVRMDWDLLDDVHSRITLIKGGQTDGLTRKYGNAPNSVQVVQEQTFVHEANVKIDKLMGLLDVTAGRQFYGEEGDLIVYYGPRDNYGLTISALDIFRADWNGEHMSVTGIAGKIAPLGGVATAGGNTDTDLRGVVVSCKMHEMVKPSLYLYNRVTHASGPSGATAGSTGIPGVTNGKNTNLWVAGLKAKIATGGLTASAEYAKNFGEDRTTFNNVGLGPKSGSFKGWALQLKGAYKLDLDSVGAINPWGEFGVGTGDANFAHAGNGNFQSINTDYRPGGIYGRFDQSAVVVLGQGIANGPNGSAASNGLTNRVIWGLGLKVTPSMVNKLTVGAAFYRYAFHRVAPDAGGTKYSRNIGSEIDVTGEWKHSENVTLKATAGTFQPGQHYRNLQQANVGAGNGVIINSAVMLAGDVAIKF